MSSATDLVKGREKSLLRRHPWVFSRGIQKIDGKPQLGETVDIYSEPRPMVSKSSVLSSITNSCSRLEF